MYCQNCGKEVSGNYCSNCGAAVITAPSGNDTPKSDPAPAAAAKATSATVQKSNKLFLILSVISFIACGLSVIAYLISASMTSIADTLLAFQLVGLGLFFLFAAMIAHFIQPAKQGLSVIFYVLSCLALLFFAFVGFPYSIFVPIVCILSVIVVIAVAVSGRSVEPEPLPKKKIIAVTSVLLGLSVVVFAGARVANHARNNYLSDIELNGVALSKEQLDAMDEDYLLRYSMHNELDTHKLEEFNYQPSDRQSDIIPGTEYYTNTYPACIGLQVDHSSLSLNGNTASAYSVTYAHTALHDENLRKVVDAYTSVLGSEFELDGVSYSFDDILAAPLPEDELVFYDILSKADDDIHISVSLSVNRNGYATLNVMYIF